MQQYTAHGNIVLEGRIDYLIRRHVTFSTDLLATDPLFPQGVDPIPA
ncbi:hypothetical protein AtDm6_0344 [Acetobacter tropicalis]|nr:hypothetical protein AtDm6_0344 [Acetobacter tropicalis]